MKLKLITLLILIILTTPICKAQLTYLPQGSQRASVSQRIGISDIIIEYSRPKVNGREVWGALVPYGLAPSNFGTAKEVPWRAGANENTTIHFPKEVKIEGKPLPAGTYGLHMIPKDDGTFTLIFSLNSSAWGSFFYDQSQDALRIDVMSKEAPFHELLTFNFIDTQANSATAALFWEKKMIPFKIELDVNKIVLEQIEKDLQNSLGFSRQTWEQAAGFALQAGDLDKAELWINKAISGQFFSQKTFQNTYTKSAILKAQGKEKESEDAFNEAIAMGNNAQLNFLGYQLLGQQNFSKAIEVLKINTHKNPLDPNVFDSLGEAYKLAGDKENAIKNFKISLSMKPPANVKANSIKNLKELGVEVNP